MASVLRLVFFVAAFFFALGQPVAARVCTDDLDLEAIDIVTSLNSPSVQTDLLQKAQERAAQNDAKFCLLYELGRYLVSNSDNEQARQLLIRSLAVATDANKMEFAPYNVIGFSYLAEKRFDAALENFSLQIQSPFFQRLPEDLKARVWNNAGYTLIQLGRYSEAKENLALAEAAGNSNATRNLEALESLVSTLSSSDINLPGVFAAVVASAKSRKAADQELEKARRLLAGLNTKIEVFKMGNGRYSLTIGSYRSYPRAMADRDAAVAAGVADAYVSSLTDWELVPSDTE